MQVPKFVEEEYNEAAHLMQALDRLRHTWGHVRPPTQVRHGEVMLLGCLVERESRGESPLTIGDLARMLRQSPSAITQKVNALEEEGVIRRTAGTKDRRIARVELTSKGRKMAEQTMQAYWQRLEKALEDMGKRDAEELVRLMYRLCEVLEADGERTKLPGDEQKMQDILQRS